VSNYYKICRETSSFGTVGQE